MIDFKKLNNRIVKYSMTANIMCNCNIKAMENTFFSYFEGNIKNLQETEKDNIITKNIYNHCISNIHQFCNINNFKVVVSNNAIFNKDEFLKNNYEYISDIETVNKKEYTIYLKKDKLQDLTHLKISIPENTSIKNINTLFYKLEKLEKLDLSDTDMTNINIDKISDELFKDCVNLKELNLSNVKGNVISFLSKFKNSLKSLKILHLSDITISKTEIDNIFKDFDNLESIQTPKLVIKK